VDPETGRSLEPSFTALSLEQLDQVTAAAEAAVPAYRTTTPTERAAFLDAIADRIEALGDQLVERARAESGLAVQRLTGERARTCAQLRLFADVVRHGDHLGVRVDPGLPDREPSPRPDVRMRQVPLGPVVVFGASNFPLAFSTAGGDTASALAAGCPVIVKAHPAHPGTAELVARAVTDAAGRTGMPVGVFSLVHGLGTEVGTALVQDPRVQAVGFTGSRQGGLALVAAAAARPRPIPVYAEMSSTNPVVLLEGAVRADPEGLAQAYLGSLTLGAGQFCTNPGLVFVPEGDAGDAFVAAVREAAGATAGQTMLTPAIREAYAAGTSTRLADERLRLVAEGSPGSGPNAPASAVLEAQLSDVVADPELQGEVFGASGLLVRYAGLDDLLQSLRELEGQLTATVHAVQSDHPEAARLLPTLELLAGRVIFNGWPTGVEVCPAMVHGGPFPATSDSRTTSVGTLAIERFQRPVCYQDVPADLLPQPLQDDNPWGLTRRVDGRLMLGTSG
jgi:NADP-dependent aldehyde dehydrogenase